MTSGQLLIYLVAIWETKRRGSACIVCSEGLNTKKKKKIVFTLPTASFCFCHCFDRRRSEASRGTEVPGTKPPLSPQPAGCTSPLRNTTSLSRWSQRSHVAHTRHTNPASGLGPSPFRKRRSPAAGQGLTSRCPHRCRGLLAAGPGCRSEGAGGCRRHRRSPKRTTVAGRGTLG